MNLPYIAVEGIVEGVQTVGRKYFSRFFHVKKSSLLNFLMLVYYLYKNRFRYGIQKKAKGSKRPYETKNLNETQRKM